MKDYKFINDMLLRTVEVKDCKNSYKYELVLTKNEFIACYNKWIKESDHEND